jgi:hypothetical protein
MLITLAWMALWQSAILSAALTVLVLALAWQKAAVWLIAVVAVSMIWRGEAWKAVFLATEAKASQLPPQCRQLLPKTAFCFRSSWSQSLAAISREGLCTKSDQRLEVSAPFRLVQNASESSLVCAGKDWSSDLRGDEILGRAALSPLLVRSQNGIPAEPASNYQNDRHPNTCRLYMTYIV